MTNKFASEYARLQEIKAAFDAAADENDKESARQDHKRWDSELKMKGEVYQRIFHLYEEARERGNEYIDLHDCIGDQEVKQIINDFKEFGIEKFTFSSTWSSAVETAWLFLQSGCKLEGLIEINGSCKRAFDNEYEKAHGYLFCIEG